VSPEDQIAHSPARFPISFLQRLGVPFEHSVVCDILPNLLDQADRSRVVDLAPVLNWRLAQPAHKLVE